MQQFGDVRLWDCVVGQHVVVCGGDELLKLHLTQLVGEWFQSSIFLGQEDHADEDHAHSHGEAEAEPERRRRGRIIVVIGVNQGH